MSNASTVFSKTNGDFANLICYAVSISRSCDILNDNPLIMPVNAHAQICTALLVARYYWNGQLVCTPALGV